MFGLTIISCIIVAAYGQSPSMGRCHDPNTSFVLDLSKFAGFYYEVEKSFSVMEMKGKCQTSEYTLLSDNKMKVVHREISKLTNLESGLIGEVTANGTELTNKYYIPMVGPITTKTWVVGTDHDTFAVLWSCSNYGIMHIAYGWTLAKEGYKNEDFSAKSLAAFQQANVKPMTMHKINHTDCS